MSEHTATPWRVEKDGVWNNVVSINDEVVIGSEGIDQLNGNANAELIVQAVNALATLRAERDELRKALLNVSKYLEAFARPKTDKLKAEIIKALNTGGGSE